MSVIIPSALLIWPGFFSPEFFGHEAFHIFISQTFVMFLKISNLIRIRQSAIYETLPSISNQPRNFPFTEDMERTYLFQVVSPVRDAIILCDFYLEQLIVSHESGQFGSTLPP